MDMKQLDEGKKGTIRENESITIHVHFHSTVYGNIAPHIICVHIYTPAYISMFVCI